MVLNESLNDGSDRTKISEMICLNSPIVEPLFAAIRKLKQIEILDITPYKEDYIDKAAINHNTYNDLVINLQICRKRKYCDKFRSTLKEGIPTSSAYLCTYHYRNNKPSA